MNEPQRAVRSKVLLITRNMPPLVGGMERLNKHMAVELAKEFEVAVIGPQGCRAYLPDHIHVSEVTAWPLWRFFFGALRSSVTMTVRFRPDVVLAGSGLTAPFAWIAAKLRRTRSAVYTHGLDLIANHPVYRWFWRPFIRRADLCIVNSHNTASLAASIGVAMGRIRIVHPGVELPILEAVGRNDFRQRFDLGNGPLLLSVGRLIPRKGLLEFVENSMPMIVAKYPGTRLVVLGDEIPHLLHGNSAGLGERIRRSAAQLGIAENLRFIGQQDDATLAAAYRAADVHVFPVREFGGDVEGFGMVAVEAAAHGLPTVAFAVSGVPDAVAESKSGYLVPSGDYLMMTERLVELFGQQDRTALRHSAREFARQFEWSRFGETMRGCLVGLQDMA